MPPLPSPHVRNHDTRLAISNPLPNRSTLMYTGSPTIRQSFFPRDGTIDPLLLIKQRGLDARDSKIFIDCKSPYEKWTGQVGCRLLHLTVQTLTSPLG